MGGLLERKFVKQTKFFSGRRRDLFQPVLVGSGIDHVWAIGTRILGNTDAAVRKKIVLIRFDGWCPLSLAGIPRVARPVIVVRKYWISTSRLRTKTTWATSEMPVIQTVAVQLGSSIRRLRGYSAYG